MSDELQSVWLWLTMNHENPSDFDVGHLRPEIDLQKISAEVNALVAPSNSPRAVATMIDNVFDALHYGNITTAQADAYIEVLSVLPADLIELSRFRILTTHKWPTPPKPADFMEAVKPELLDRQCAAFRATWLLDHAVYVRQFAQKDRTT